MRGLLVVGAVDHQVRLLHRLEVDGAEQRRQRLEQRRVVGSWDDGSIAVELSFAGVEWLVREVLKEAGDAAVLDPPDARAAVLAAAARIE